MSCGQKLCKSFCSIMLMIIGILSIVLGCEIGKYEVDSQMFVNWNDTLTFSAGLILGGISLILTSLLGMFSSRKSCQYGLFQLMTIIVIIGLISSGGISLVLIQKVDQGCNSLLFQKMNDLAIFQDNLICQTSCPCDLNDSSGFPNATIANNNVFNVKQCEDFNKHPPLQDALMIRVMEWVELRHDCAGVCQKANHFFLTDINRGKPSNSCQEILIDKIEKIILAAIVLSFLLSFLLLTSLIYGSAKNSQGNIYPI